MTVIPTLWVQCDPTDEIAQSVGKEEWYDVLTSPPSTPHQASPPGWELIAVQSFDFRDLIPVPLQREKVRKSYRSSRFCHICGRNAANIRTAPCGRVIGNRCRKIVCERCAHRHAWTDAPLHGIPTSSWICSHCRGVCPPKAQCNRYSRTYLKRNSTKLRRRQNKLTK